ncbi:hypothetical protein B0J14DRAFT_681482, partial [Halenospora varia]
NIIFSKSQNSLVQVFLLWLASFPPKRIVVPNWWGRKIWCRGSKGWSDSKQPAIQTSDKAIEMEDNERCWYLGQEMTKWERFICYEMIRSMGGELWTDHRGAAYIHCPAYPNHVGCNHSSYRRAPPVREDDTSEHPWRPQSTSPGHRRKQSSNQDHDRGYDLERRLLWQDTSSNYRSPTPVRRGHSPKRRMANAHPRNRPHHNYIDDSRPQSRITDFRPPDFRPEDYDRNDFRLEFKPDSREHNRPGYEFDRDGRGHETTSRVHADSPSRRCTRSPVREQTRLDRSNSTWNSSSTLPPASHSSRQRLTPRALERLDMGDKYPNSDNPPASLPEAQWKSPRRERSLSPRHEGLLDVVKLFLESSGAIPRARRTSRTRTLPRRKEMQGNGKKLKRKRNVSSSRSPASESGGSASPSTASQDSRSPTPERMRTKRSSWAKENKHVDRDLRFDSPSETGGVASFRTFSRRSRLPPSVNERNTKSSRSKEHQNRRSRTFSPFERLYPRKPSSIKGDQVAQETKDNAPHGTSLGTTQMHRVSASPSALSQSMSLDSETNTGALGKGTIEHVVEEYNETSLEVAGVEENFAETNGIMDETAEAEDLVFIPGLELYEPSRFAGPEDSTPMTPQEDGEDASLISGLELYGESRYVRAPSTPERGPSAPGAAQESPTEREEWVDMVLDNSVLENF